MGTKNNPGAYDCIANAEPDEPYFTLLGRDPVAAKLVKEWAQTRFARLPNFGRDNPEEMAQIDEALQCAKQMQEFWTERQRLRNEARIASEKDAMAHAEKLGRWRRCPSTHCERSQECRSPHDCTVKSREPDHADA